MYLARVSRLHGPRSETSHEFVGGRCAYSNETCAHCTRGTGGEEKRLGARNANKHIHENIGVAAAAAAADKVVAAVKVVAAGRPLGRGKLLRIGRKTRRGKTWPSRESLKH